MGYLEPNPQNKSKCVVARTVTSVKNGITTARVLNLANQDIILREGMHLGEFFSELGSLPQAPAGTLSAISATGPLLPLQESPASQQQKAQLEDYWMSIGRYSARPQE